MAKFLHPFSCWQPIHQEQTVRQFYRCSKILCLYRVSNTRSRRTFIRCPPTPNQRTYFAPSVVVRQVSGKAASVHGERSIKAHHQGKSLMINCLGQQKPTRCLSFGTWKRATQRRKKLEQDGKPDIIVITVWGRAFVGCMQRRGGRSQAWVF